VAYVMQSWACTAAVQVCAKAVSSAGVLQYDTHISYLSIFCAAVLYVR
jgi:hypothetical protein